MNVELSAILTAIVELHNLRSISWQIDATELSRLDLHRLIHGDGEDARVVETSHDSDQAFVDTISA